MSYGKQGSRSAQALTRSCCVNIVRTFGSTCSATRCSYYHNPVGCDPLIKSDAVEGLGAKTFYSAADIDLISPEVRRLLNQLRRSKVGD